ncbi:hypothetical protein ASPACDRAFT_116756 [Aspergillus aculeatus ATCC 16872]|uniref:NAD(P)-binding protein n=1 Tax=Aspergillus aculeatus (strain ATCC 16872 / CBS 172.66 / WB 5094) TaxID=690307 RepID=A0A1L9WZV7_ASPA1|nr:uncharacterized protein ASPACDRAFT_116756 [Aspergillus aculeatus ATCC 16872]OJK01787.1 hypothetical protein ASPACDRAFT_116756 [Aspergillus aculeatus ATCC 16872]
MTLNRYAPLHTHPQGLSDARPTATQILADQNLLDTDAWNDKTILITGGTAGLGAESARVLHRTGAKIFITGRDVAKGERLAREISAANPESSAPAIEVIHMDYYSLQSVRNGADEFLRRSGGKLHVLLANAGVVASPRRTTDDGFEGVFGVNYLAGFLLVHLLAPALVASATSDFCSRLVVVSSAGHRAKNVDPDDYNGLVGEYNASKAYAQSKTATILMANEFERQYAERGVHALSLNPGIIMDTEISRGLPGSSSGRREQYYKMEPLLAKMEKSVEQGAATQVWAAVASELEGKGGLYLDDVQVADEADEASRGQFALPGWASWIWDEAMAARLWEDSLKMVGLGEQVDVS